VCFSDHHLLTCCLEVPLPQAVTATFTYRLLRRIDTKAFYLDILQSELFGELDLDADGYADLFDAAVKRVLDIHAPLRTGRRRCGQRDSRHLSDKARQAKQLRRRLERRYRRTGLQSDKQAYQSACSAARKSISGSRSDHIKAQLDEASGDIRATWRTAQKLLHSRQKVVYDDDQCAQLVSTFCQFFVDKVRRILNTMQSFGRRTFAIRQHLRPELPSFEPVTIEEVRKLLSTMPPKSSPLDVLPCQLYTQVMRLCFPASHRQTRQPVTADWNVYCPIQDGAGAFIAEEGRARHFSASELQADLQPVDRLHGSRETSVGMHAASSARLC